jgi:hypothetical protein
MVSEDFINYWFAGKKKSLLFHTFDLKIIINKISKL